MLTVVKRSGKSEPFDPQKLENSLAAASDELRKPLSQGDINLIMSPVLRAVVTKQSVTSSELYDLLAKSIEDAGFGQIARVYREYAKNRRG